MAIGRINEVAALTGFSNKKMHGRFAGEKVLAVNNEMTVRRGSTHVHYLLKHLVFLQHFTGCAN